MMILKLLKWIVVIICIPIFSFCQDSKYSDKLESKIDDNIFRVVLTRNVPNSMSIQYERKIKNAFTVVIETGPTVDIKTFGDIEDPSKSKYQFAFSLFGSFESRYYFNLNRRIKRGKAVRNNSALYISLQEFVLSNPFLLINQKSSQAFQGNIQTFLNIGWQKQFKNFYFQIFGGPSLARKTFSNYFPDQYIDKFQFGLAIGIVL